VSDGDADAGESLAVDARGRIGCVRTRLRALWGNFPVMVRVHSGALKKSR
jgi:hypothetical protein